MKVTLEITPSATLPATVLAAFVDKANKAGKTGEARLRELVLMDAVKKTRKAKTA